MNHFFFFFSIVIDTPINLAGDRAIHYVCRMKDDKRYLKILQYLANSDNGADVNGKLSDFSFFKNVPTVIFSHFFIIFFKQ